MQDLSNLSLGKKMARYMKPITDQGNLPTEDLIPSASVRRLTYYSDGKPMDERPIITDPVTGSTGKVTRFMYFRKDIPGEVGAETPCLRFEVSVVKPGRKSHHHERDCAIWSLPVSQVINNDALLTCMQGFGVGLPQIRSAMKDAGFSPRF